MIPNMHFKVLYNVNREYHSKNILKNPDRYKNLVDSLRFCGTISKPPKWIIRFSKCSTSLEYCHCLAKLVLHLHNKLSSMHLSMNST